MPDKAGIPKKQEQLSALGRRPGKFEKAKLLTRTEIKVLRLILDGKSNREIAELLHRSLRTIEIHRSHIMRKLGVDNLIDLVKRATAEGLLHLPSAELEQSKSLRKLTKTEIKVLRHILDGKSNKQIANLLHLSFRTIEKYRSQIMHKLGVDNLVDLIKRAAALGLIDEAVSPPEEKLLVRAYVDESTNDDELVNGIVEFYRTLNKYHILCGGRGLAIDDWHIFVPKAQPVEELV